ncbi:tetratricopeptide repeat protein, partial [Christiangramia aquimixticola]|uniref:tetratricopeptide repeat protein n=1 Tax=Christiangramia aquimixticola TaxID=1697558 RepID=UPI003AA7C214
ILTAALSVLTLSAFAQKDQIKNAEDAIEDSKFDEAKAQLKIAEPKLSELNSKWQERFYLYKGQAYAAGTPTNADLETAAMAYAKAVEMGNDDAVEALASLKNDLLNSAIEDQGTENYESAAEKLYTSYKISKQDTVYLYYAANNLVQAQNYDKAVEFLQQLNDLGYDGSGKSYTAVNVETGEKENLGSKQQMDLMIKTGQYTDPQVEKIPSKKGEIASLIARIYINQKQFDKAIASIDEAKAANPNDVSLLLSEANMYYQMGEQAKAIAILENAGEMDKTNPTVFNNIGLMYMELKDSENAIRNYEKALEIDPEFNDARINLAAAMLNAERAIIEEMNGLGMSKKDNQRYDELDKQRKEIYRSVLPFLEKAMEIEPDNTEIVRTAMNLYTNLGMQEKADELKAKL